MNCLKKEAAYVSRRFGLPAPCQSRPGILPTCSWLRCRKLNSVNHEMTGRSPKTGVRAPAPLFSGILLTFVKY